MGVTTATKGDFERFQMEVPDLASLPKDPPKTYSPFLSRFIMWLERKNREASIYGNPAIFDTRSFSWVQKVERSFPDIRKELLQVLERREELPNFQDIATDVRTITKDDHWKTFFLSGYGLKSLRNMRRCPKTVRALRSIPGVKTVFFSILSPGKQIPVHKGPYNGVLRYHLGLVVPKKRENCAIWINGQFHHWEEGKSLIFDDSFYHAAWNNTDEVRAILFLDFVRPMKFPFNLLNRAVLAIAPIVMPNFREGFQNHKKWEKKFYR